MIKPIFAKSLFGLGGSIILFCVWYSIAANYSYAALEGTYDYKGKGETCTLYLRSNHTFLQEFRRSGNVQKAQGTWNRYGQSHVSFSQEFLKMSGEEMNADGQAHGQFQKNLGIFPIMVVAPLPDGPHFHRRLL